MLATTHLAFINFAIGDIQGGLGPFLATWLATTGEWSPARIGSVTTIVGLVTLALSGPLGALVDTLDRPRLLIIAACLGILGGTALLIGTTSYLGVMTAQILAATGGTLLPPAVIALTLGIVGKDRFPHQQGVNQAWNHAGILVAAGLISIGTGWFGPATSLWVLGAMAVLAVGLTWTTPGHCYNGRRARGWQEEEDAPAEKQGLRAVLSNKRLLTLAIALALFNLGNGAMLGLLGQKLVQAGQDGTAWTARYVMVAQLVMIPVALAAGSLADRRGRRLLLMVAFAILPIRAAISAFVDDPTWLIAAEVLDGLASGIVGVAVPVVVADLTWGSGRTQTAMGSVNAVQGLGGALSAWFGGIAQSYLGWQGCFLALGVPALLALVLVFWLSATTEPGRRARRRQRREDATREVQPQAG